MKSEINSNLRVLKNKNKNPVTKKNKKLKYTTKI